MREESPPPHQSFLEGFAGGFAGSYNETGISGEYTVTDTISHEDESIAYVTISGEEIETTPWHLFYTDEGWAEAEDLQEGDSIVSLGGIYGTVDSVIIVDAVQTMYDLTVEEVHTFAVGDGNWVVHNTDCGEAAEIFVDQMLRSQTRFADRGHVVGEDAVARFFGVSRNDYHLPEGLYRRNDGSYVVVEVKNTADFSITQGRNNALAKFEDVTTLAQSSNVRISGYEVYVNANTQPDPTTSWPGNRAPTIGQFSQIRWNITDRHDPRYNQVVRVPGTNQHISVIRLNLPD